MDSYSLVITSTNQQNQSKTKTIGYIKSDAQPSDLKSAAQQLTALTNNIYESADRVAKENVDTASDLIPRSNVAFYMKLGTGTETDITDQNEVTVDISTLTAAKSDTRFCMSLGYNDNTKALTDINSVMSTWSIESDADDFTPNYQTTWVSADANGRLFYTTIALHQRVARDIALVLKVPAFGGYAPTSKSLTMHFVNGGE